MVLSILAIQPSIRAMEPMNGCDGVARSTVTIGSSPELAADPQLTRDRNIVESAVKSERVPEI